MVVRGRCDGAGMPIELARRHSTLLTTGGAPIQPPPGQSQMKHTEKDPSA